MNKPNNNNFKVPLLFFKMLSLFIIPTVFISSIVFFIIFILTIILLFNKILIIGLIITSLCLSIISIQLLSLSINILFSKEHIRNTLYVFIGSLVGLVIGSIILFFDVNSYKLINNNYNLVTSSKTILMNNDLIISNYQNKIKFIIDDSLIDNIKIELTYKKSPIDVSINNEGNSVYYIQTNKFDIKKLANKIFNDFKNKKIYIYDYNYTVNVYGSKNNVESIIKNSSKKFFLNIEKTNNEIVVSYLQKVSDEMICELGDDSLYHCFTNKIANIDDCSCLYNNQLNLIDCSSSPKCSCENNVCLKN